MKKYTCISWYGMFRILTLPVVLFLLPELLYAQRGQLYSGLLERGYPKAQYANTPYFPQEFQEGKVTYQGYTYDNVRMRADLATGQLIVLSPATGYSLTFAPGDLDRIELNGLELVHLDKPSSGWYEVLASGKDWVLYRQNYVTNSTRETRGSNMVIRYSLGQKIVLQKGGVWKSVKNLAGFCKQFRGYRSRILSFAKLHGLKPNVQNPKDWKMLEEFINSL